MSAVSARNPRQKKALSLEQILEIVQAQDSQATITTAANGERSLQIRPSELPAVARALKEDDRTAFEQLCCLTGVDLLKFPAQADQPATDALQCVYDLHSVVHTHSLRLKVTTPRQAAEIPSVEAVWGVATFFEREIFDLLGVAFPGHHDLRRLLLPPDWVGHPLRKDYVYPETYGGVELKREGQTFESGPYT
ncbi:MAG: NADH-quinone oxidoreductase subunit C [Fibrobacteria bacterium]|nr:NADH-quinone oxidoreductase subunit C [Fibrobacteria bacterium]